mmetsp:Transcript_95134/g.217844  ORF Transcript_95134/g.217844 Transcript_95134/m.217844 type:complete len:92 (-) Transcript_95134:98-373(-)
MHTVFVPERIVVVDATLLMAFAVRFMGAQVIICKLICQTLDSSALIVVITSVLQLSAVNVLTLLRTLVFHLRVFAVCMARVAINLRLRISR